MTGPRVAVLVPRRGGQPDRDALWSWCRDWWSRHFPDWPIVEGHHYAEEGLFNRSAAVNRAARAAGDGWDVALIIDADVIADPDRIRAAVDVARDTGRMAQPFTIRRDLNARGTERVMAGYAGSWARWVHREYRDTVSSIIAVSRPLWATTGGFDEAFVGWGFEDNAFAVACETFGGPIERIEGEVWHLWHATAPEGKRGTPSHQRNRARAARYLAVRGDQQAVAALRHETTAFEPIGAGIPRVLHRVVPRETSPQVEEWWAAWCALHPGWLHRTWRDPIDPARFPLTGPHWPLVRHGAQLADLVRLEVLWMEGGIYVDSDMEPYRALDPLLPLSAFAGWEDRHRVPNAVMGAVPSHPAIRECIDLAVARLTAGSEDIPWATGPGVLTEVLPWRADVLLLPPGSFYPYHYRDARTERGRRHDEDQPWAFGAHHWAGSWLPEGKRW